MVTAFTYRYYAAVLLVWMIGAVSLGAQRFWDATITLELRPQAVPEEMTWSRNLMLTANGLDTGPPASATSFRDFWLQTPPLATGPSWGPPTNVTMSMTLNDVEVVETMMRAALTTFARYSTDRVHWSSWFRFRRLGVRPSAERTCCHASLGSDSTHSCRNGQGRAPSGDRTSTRSSSGSPRSIWNSSKPRFQ